MKHLIIGTAGHVDHGKTALIKALTSIDCDTHPEEKERGITINLGFAHLDLPSGESVGIVDVPGHKDFIKTMVAGAYGIDMVILVVAADSGIMPQTIEHVQIIQMLGVKQGIVALNKADLVDEETLELAQLEIAEFLENTSLRDATIIPVSSITGKGIDRLASAIAGLVPRVQEKPISDRFRMYIDRIFNVKGIGFVVTGSVLEGSATTGQELFLLPGKSKKVKIRGLERHGQPVNKVFSGDRAALNLAGLKFEDYSRGMVLSGKPLDETSLLDATLTLFDKNTVLTTWTSVIFYSGTFECAARIHLLDKEELQAGETAIVQIHLSRQAILLTQDRFIIRNSSNDLTFGGGIVIDAHPLHHKRRTDKLIQELTELMEATLHSDKLINLMRIELGKTNTPVFARNVATKLMKNTEEIVSECGRDSKKDIRIVKKDNQILLLREERNQQYRASVLEEIAAWHQKNPVFEEGLDTVEFYGKFGFGTNEAGKIYLDWLLLNLSEEGLLKRIGNTWALASHRATVDAKTREQLDWLEQTLLETGMEKPLHSAVEELAHTERINKERLKMLLKYLSKQGKLVWFEGEYIHKAIVDRCRLALLEIIAAKEDGINEKEFRELIGGTKKLVQMLLGIYLEEGTVTKRTFYILITDRGREWLAARKNQLSN